MSETKVPLKDGPTVLAEEVEDKCFCEGRGRTWARKGGWIYSLDGIWLQNGTADSLSLKVYEPLLVVGLDKFAGLDIRVRVSGGGHTSQI